jgi:hypothetical protein
MHVREALREVSACQIASELALDVIRQRARIVLAGVLEELLEVLLPGSHWIGPAKEQMPKRAVSLEA